MELIDLHLSLGSLTHLASTAVADKHELEGRGCRLIGHGCDVVLAVLMGDGVVSVGRVKVELDMVMMPLYLAVM